MAKAVEIKEAEIIAPLLRQIKDLEQELARAKAMRDDYESWYRTENKLVMEQKATIDNLKNVIASMDPAEMQKVMGEMVQDHKNDLTMKDHTIAQLREDLHRCLGWICAKNEQHPVPTRPEPGYHPGKVNWADQNLYAPKDRP